MSCKKLVERNDDDLDLKLFSFIFSTYASGTLKLEMEFLLDIKPLFP